MPPKKRQPARTKVRRAPPRRPQPRRRAPARRPRQSAVRAANPTDVRVRGKDLVALKLVRESDIPGKVIWEVACHPHSFHGTRLFIQSSTYGLWRPQSLTLHVVSSASAVTNGNFVIAWAPRKMPSVSAESHAQFLLANPASRMVAFKQGRASLRVPTVTKQKWLVSDTTVDDESMHGYFYMVLMGPPNITQGAISLSVSLDWVVNFSQPSLPQENVRPPAVCTDNGPYASALKDYPSTTILHGASLGHQAAFRGAVNFAVYQLMPPPIGWRPEAPPSVIDKRENYYYGVWAPQGTWHSMYLFWTLEGARKFAADPQDSNATLYYKDGDTVDPVPVGVMTDEPPSALTQGFRQLAI